MAFTEILGADLTKSKTALVDLKLGSWQNLSDFFVLKTVFVVNHYEVYPITYSHELFLLSFKLFVSIT